MYLITESHIEYEELLKLNSNEHHNEKWAKYFNGHFTKEDIYVYVTGRHMERYLLVTD